ncbi:MAG TPA: response regulator [Blastocatellia bacterium]|nr:response regulator [Blastocatellia bacterium]
MAKILVVDERASSRNFFVTLLQQHGHQIQQTPDGGEALALAEAEQPNLIITDILLPTMDGPELVRRLRSNRVTAGTPVIFSTAHYLEREARVLARSCCVFTVLALPADPTDVAAAVGDALALRDRARSLAANGSQQTSELGESQRSDDTKVMNLRQTALLQLNLALSSERDADKLLQSACRGARRIIGSRYSTIGVISEDGVLGHFFPAGYELEEVARPDSQMLRQGLFGKVMTQRRTARLAGLDNIVNALGLSPYHPRIESIICAPIASPSRVFGWLCLAQKLGADEFRRDEELLAAMLAAQLGRFYENLCLFETVNRKMKPADAEPIAPRVNFAPDSDEKMEALTRFARGVAGDFNNLVTEVLNYKQAVQSVGEKSAMDQGLEDLHAAGERAATVARPLLVLAGKHEQHPRVFDLNTIVSDMEKLLTRLVGESIEVNVTLSASPALVKADPRQLEQAIMNLVVNSRDAMPQGGKLRIETAAVEFGPGAGDGTAGGRFVELTIGDTGCGMDEQTRSRIFEPFYSTKSGVERAGLGLATVQSIVSCAGGGIVVDSQPGKGTTLKIYLPRIRGATGALWDPGQSRSMPKGTETVLLVEDESFVRELAAVVLKEQGYSVIEAPDGAVAMGIARSSPEDAIDLVVAGVSTPKVGGNELAEWFKAKRPRTKVILVSARADNETVAPAGTRNSNSLQKPFTPSSLARKVREVLDQG